MGLGSKTFMAYCDNAIVTSITEGVKRTYNVFFNEQGIPAIALLSQSPTNEGSGLSIQIPVKESDYEKFREATTKALRFFKIKPIITGGKVEWKNEIAIFSGNGWESHEKLEGSFAIQGGVAYPIDSYKIKGDYYDMLSRGGLVLYFDMGEVNFTPSRESLSYDEHTINSINNKLKFVQTDFVKRVNEMIQNKPTILDALNAVYNLKNKFAYIKGMTIADKIVWKNQDISNPIEFISDIANKGCVTYKKPAYYRRKINESVYPDLTAIWVYDDLGKGAIARVKNWITTNEDKPLTLFTSDSYNELVKSGFPKDQFVLASSLPVPVKTRKNGTIVRSKKEKGKFNMYDLGNTESKAWDSNEFDSTNEKEVYPKYYLVKSNDWNFTIFLDKIKKSISEKSDLFKLMEFMGLTTQDLMMIGERNLKYLPDTCTNFMDAVEALEFKFDQDALDTIECYSEHIYEQIAKTSDFKSLSDKHPFKKYVKKVLGAFETHSKFKRICYWLGDKRNGKPYEFEGNEIVKQIIGKLGNYSWEISLAVKIIANLK
jgi:hypothetical protein